MTPVDDMLPSQIQFALSAWAANTGCEWNGPEIREAAEMIGHLKEVDQVRALAATQELWLTPPRGPFPGNHSEVEWLALVIAFYEEGFTNYDADQIRDALHSVHGTEDEALLTGLGLLKEQARASGQYADLEGLTLASLDADNRREMHLWMTNTAPGYDWFHVGDVGFVLYRLS